MAVLVAEGTVSQKLVGVVREPGWNHSEPLTQPCKYIAHRTGCRPKHNDTLEPHSMLSCPSALKAPFTPQPESYFCSFQNFWRSDHFLPQEAGCDHPWLDRNVSPRQASRARCKAGPKGQKKGYSQAPWPIQRIASTTTPCKGNLN